MTKLQWTGVIGALGVGVLLQIPTHNHEEMPGHEHDLAAVTGENVVTLAVSGMT